MQSLPCSLIRGGTSRGAFFNKADLPFDTFARDALLVRAMGGPDELQIDGVGGGHPLTSKVAIVSPSVGDVTDVDYLFLQISPDKQTVSDTQNCGNLLAGVGVYALEENMLQPTHPTTTVRVRMLNTGAICHLQMPTPQAVLDLTGDTRIDGVPGTAAAIVCNYLDIAGSACGALLPTGNLVDEVDGVKMTCVDNGMPVITMLARDLGVTGYESPAELDANSGLKDKLENIRLIMGPRMNLGDVEQKSVPKLCLLSPPFNGGLVMTRTFIPNFCHKTIGVLGAVSVATVCLLPGSIAADLGLAQSDLDKPIAIEHPEGSLQVKLEANQDGDITKAGIIRTARMLFKGEIYV
ncbi:MAG: 4-oxalomesaconate tautomerase [Limisphaerales bacterium]|jgi:4-oxalomesaconate tautomerase